MRILVEQELADCFQRPDKAPLNAMAVAQFIWSDKYLIEHQIGDFEDDFGELPKELKDKPPNKTGKKRGRKSGRPGVGETEKDLFAGSISYF